MITLLNFTCILAIQAAGSWLSTPNCFSELLLMQVLLYGMHHIHFQTIFTFSQSLIYTHHFIISMDECVFAYVANNFTKV